MKKTKARLIYLVIASYEDDRESVRAFNKEVDAWRFRDECDDYVTKAPQCPRVIEDTVENDRLWEQHAKRCARFAEKHPAGSHVMCHGFQVITVELH